MKVPLFKQKTNSCGTTSLRMVMSFLGVDVSEEEIIRGVGGLKSYGVKTVALAEYAKKKGFKTILYSFSKKLSEGKAVIKNPRVLDIRRFLDEGVPVIINVRYSLLKGKSLTKAGHFIVVTNYENGVFIYNDPSDGREHKIDEEMFRLAWFSNIFDSSAYLLVLRPKKVK